MTLPTQEILELPLYVAGKAVKTTQSLDVHCKFSGNIYARVALADEKILEKAISAAVTAENFIALC